MRLPRACAAAVAILVTPFALGCSGSDGPAAPGGGDDDTPTVQTVQVVSATGDDDLFVGATLQLTAHVIDNRGNAMTGQNLVWSTSAGSIATVSQTGLVTAHAPGAVQVSATAGGRMGQLGVTVLADPCRSAGEITIGQTVNGVLSTIACRMSNGTYADRWRLQVGTQQRLRLDMISTAFDTYLIVQDANGQTLVQDDDSGDGTSSRIDREFAPGTYFILANSFEPNQTGSYTLSVTELPASGACSTLSELAMSETVTAALTSGDCMLNTGSFVDVWRIQLTASTNVRFVMTSSAFDAYLFLVNSGGTVLAEDNDSFGNRNARIERTLAPGTYFIWAASATSGAIGNYQISALPFSSLRMSNELAPAVEPDSAAKAAAIR